MRYSQQKHKLRKIWDRLFKVNRELTLRRSEINRLFLKGNEFNIIHTIYESEWEAEVGAFSL